MITIKSLEVKNFKSLANTTIAEFGPVNMFYGYNNCGKSNIFKFLKLLFEKKKIGTKVKYNANEDGLVSSPKSSTRIQTTNFWNGSIWNEPFLFTNNDRSKPITFKIILNITDDALPEGHALKEAGYLIDGSVEITFSGQITALDHETSELRVQEGLLHNKRFFKFEDEISIFFEESENEKLSSKLGENILNIFDDLILLIDSDRNFTTEISKNGTDNIDVKNFKNGLFELSINAEKNETFSNVIKFLNGFDFSPEAKEKLGGNVNSFPFKVGAEIGFSKFEEEIEIMLRNDIGRLPLKNYGTGIQQFLYILARVSNNKSKIVIVEELELNLSPLYQVELLRFLIALIPNFYDQLIFSSHSPFFTQKDSSMIDIIHHVRIDFGRDTGTTVECHDDITSSYDEDTNQSYLSLLYS